VAVAILTRAPLSEIHGNLVSNRPALLSVFFPAAIIAVFNNMLFGIGEIFHSNVWWSRAFAMREGIGVKAYLLAGVVWLPIPVVAGFLGLAAPSVGINVTRPDVVGPLVAANILGYAGSVLVFIVVFCSLASSIDSLLAATSDVVTKEVVQPLFMPNASDKQIRKVASMVIVAVGLTTWAICLPKVGTLATVLFFAGPLVGSTIWPIISGLFWQRCNPAGAVLAMVLGSAVGLIAYVQIGWYTATLISTAMSFLTVIGTTLLWPRAFDWRSLAGGKEAVPA